MQTYLLTILIQFLPYLLLFAFFVLIMRTAKNNPTHLALLEESRRQSAAMEAVVKELAQIREVLLSSDRVNH